MARKTALVREVLTPIVPARERRPATRSQRVSHHGLLLTRQEMAAITFVTTLVARETRVAPTAIPGPTPAARQAA
jgi:hypothetical protein